MYKLKNYMEDVVKIILNEIIYNINVCDCEKCRMDIAAIALNKLPHRYIVSEKGELYSKINTLRQQFEVDIVSAITHAAMQVSSNPRH